jgi:hypothetical protein
MTGDEVTAWNLVNTGIAIFEAPDEAMARWIVSQDPAAQGGYARGELRAFEVGILRGRDG